MSVYDESMHGQIEPLHVIVDKEGGTEELGAADFGSWQTLIILPTTAPQQLLPQANERLNAYILVTGVATGFVRLGSRAQVMNNAGGQFFATVGGNTIKYEAKQEVWVVGDGVTASLSVMTLDHRYK